MSTRAAEQLYPQKSAEEISKEQSTLETMVEYEPIPGSPMQWAKKGEKWHLIMGKWKLNEGDGFNDRLDAETWLHLQHWNIILKIASCICYDFMKPLATIQGVNNAGGKINLDPKEIIDRLKKD